MHLSRAIYALRLASGRCTAPGLPAGCGLYDPNGLYAAPPVEIVTTNGNDHTVSGAIPSSFGMSFIDVVLDPAAGGEPLTVEFTGVPGAGAEFRVQLWKLIDGGAGERPRPVPGQALAPEVLPAGDADGRVVVAIPATDLAQSNRLGLIITRVDADESSDPVGAYTIRLRAGEEAIG